MISILVSLKLTECKHNCTVYNLGFDETDHLCEAAADSIQNCTVSGFATVQQAILNSPEKPTRPGEWIKGLFRFRSCKKCHRVCLLACLLGKCGTAVLCGAYQPSNQRRLPHYMQIRSPDEVISGAMPSIQIAWMSLMPRVPRSIDPQFPIPQDPGPDPASRCWVRVAAEHDKIR